MFFKKILFFMGIFFILSSCVSLSERVDVKKDNSEQRIQNIVSNKTSFFFDFQPANTETSSYVTADGYVAVTVDATANSPRPCTVYSPERGYGFVIDPSATNKSLNARDRGTSLSNDAALRDFVSGNYDYTFKVDLENGDYTITAYVGDSADSRTTRITITDSKKEIAVLDLSAASGVIDKKSVDVKVSNKTLEFIVSDKNNIRVLNSLSIVKK
ncbi:hypothetical protein [Treponema sp. J25]|uniref:hypothetical protein n=1 Tax=Treponema sp. J25 TaxID=2094121 RepID=UPI001051A49C|nr:hypothetical protein [Treponema sp. J25]TCW61830.1 hypothetical protein C5O22_03615 [Treponema sp. J25]